MNIINQGQIHCHVCVATSGIPISHWILRILAQLSIILMFHCYTHSSGDQLNRAFVQYSFSGKLPQILQKPHGNSKSTRTFVQMTPSTLQKLKECCKTNQPPERAVSNVTKEKGGIVRFTT